MQAPHCPVIASAHARQAQFKSNLPSVEELGARRSDPVFMGVNNIQTYDATALVAENASLRYELAVYQHAIQQLQIDLAASEDKVARLQARVSDLIDESITEEQQGNMAIDDIVEQLTRTPAVDATEAYDRAMKVC